VHAAIKHAAIRSGAIAVVLLAGLAAVTGCDSGGSGPAPRSGTETLVMVTRSLANNPDFTATASGLFAAAGSLVRVGDSDDESRAVFPHGSFLVSHPHSQADVTSQSVSQATCVATEIEHAPYTISDGTGRYKGITGSGTATVTFSATLPKLKDGRCDMSSTVTPVAGTALTTIRGVGKVRIP
jgi:hypothetical protein